MRRQNLWHLGRITPTLGGKNSAIHSKIIPHSPSLVPAGARDVSLVPAVRCAAVCPWVESYHWITGAGTAADTPLPAPLIRGHRSARRAGRGRAHPPLLAPPCRAGMGVLGWWRPRQGCSHSRPPRPDSAPQLEPSSAQSRVTPCPAHLLLRHSHCATNIWNTKQIMVLFLKQ